MAESNDQINSSEGTNPEEARKLLATFSENIFSGNIRALAKELGRESDEILDILNFEEDLDEDLLITINRIAGEFDLKPGGSVKEIYQNHTVKQLDG